MACSPSVASSPAQRQGRGRRQVVAESFTGQIERLGRLPRFWQTLPLRDRLILTAPLPLPLPPPRPGTGDDDDNDNNNSTSSNNSNMPSLPAASSSSPAVALAPRATAAPTTTTTTTTAPPATAAITITNSNMATMPPALALALTITPATNPARPHDPALTYDDDPAAYGRQTPILFHVENVQRHMLRLRLDRSRAVQTIELYATVVPGQPDPAVSRRIRLTDLYPTTTTLAGAPGRVLEATLPATFAQRDFPRTGNVRVVLRVFKMPSPVHPLTGLDDIHHHMRVEVIMINGAKGKSVRDREGAIQDQLRQHRGG